MLKHTMASLNIIKGELSLLSYIANIISAIFMIGYLILASVWGRGLLAVNIALCVLTAANLLTYLITRNRCGKKSKRVRKFVKHFYNISRIILNAIPLATLLYILAFTTEEVSRIETVLLPVLIIIWLFQVVLEISSLYIQSRFTLFVDGIEMDIENLIKPLLKVRNMINGSDSEPRFDSDRVSEHNRTVLSEKVGKREEHEGLDMLSKAKEKIKELIKH